MTPDRHGPKLRPVRGRVVGNSATDLIALVHDDKDFVGTIDQKSGLFTPNLDGPNPQRRHGTNNYGDVWVVATVNNGGKPIKARAHLLVTVPLYIKWDQPEVGR